MAEQPIGREQLRGQEPEWHPEILNFERYGALYGRFLVASQAQTAEEAANIIDPDNINVEFSNLTGDTLRERNYNLVGEKSSLAERKEEWKGIEYSQAYNQWRTKFTGFMINIQDSQRESALRIIMSNSKKSKEFTVNDADALFNEFCQGKSDINNFITRVTTNLASRGKIDPTYLHELLPHLQWIASGLFGKNTASQAVTRLIELESAIHNDNTGYVFLEILNPKRMSILKPHEKNVLGFLHDSLRPQEKRDRTQGITTIATTPQPAPVTPGKEEIDEDKNELLPPPNLPESGERQPAASQGTSPTSAAEALRKEMEAAAARIRQQQNRDPAAEGLTNSVERPGPKNETPAASGNTAAAELERELALIRDLFAVPTPHHPEVQVNKPVIKEVAIGRLGLDIRLEVDGTDLGFEFVKYGEGDYSLDLTFLKRTRGTEYLDIPEGMEVYFSIKPKPNSAIGREIISIIGGKGARLNLKDLDSLDVVDPMLPVIRILTTKYEGWEERAREGLEKGRGGQAVRYNSPDSIFALPGPPIGTWMSMDELQNYLKTRKEEIESKQRAEEITTGGNVIDMEFTSPADSEDFLEIFNERLRTYKYKPHITLRFSPDQLKEIIITSLGKGYRVQTGTIAVDEPNNEITIRKVQIRKSLGRVGFDLVISNSGDGIAADIQNYDANFTAKTFGGNVKDSIKGIDFVAKEYLDKMRFPDNLSWSAGKISISDGKVLIRFDNTAPATPL